MARGRRSTGRRDRKGIVARQEVHARDGVRGFIRAREGVFQVSKDWEVGLELLERCFFIFVKKQGLGKSIGNSQRCSKLENLNSSVGLG